MKMNEIAIHVEKLGKLYRIDKGAKCNTLREAISYRIESCFQGFKSLLRARLKNESDSKNMFWALKDISFNLKKGEIVGVIGKNGAGKSTLLKILSRITEPTEGVAEISGRVGSLLEVGTGFHPELTGKENIFLNGAILGMRKDEIKKKYDEIVSFAEVEKFIDVPVKHYSSGMYVRLAFAVAAHMEPEILLVDEVLAVGDAMFQKKCLGKIGEVSNQGRTILFVSHNMQAVQQICHRSILLSSGKIDFEGIPSKTIMKYLTGSANTASEIDVSLFSPMKHAEGAALKTISFLNSANEPCFRFSIREKMRVLLKFSTKKIFENFDIAMGIVRSDGTPVFSETLSDCRKNQSIELAAGEYETSFFIDFKYLKPEIYSLSIYLTSQGRVMDSVDGVPLPEIYDPEADPFKEAHRWGSVRIPIEWTEIKENTKK